MKSWLLAFWMGLCTVVASSQALTFENIVPNPGFEDIKLNPHGWFYMGSHFSESIDKWSSPTVASPDIFAPSFVIPPNWTKRGFGKPNPYEGDSYIGITTYGCKNGKPHCREYVQVELTEKMVPGQRYRVSLWVSHFENSLAANNIGVYFSENPLWDLGTETLHLKPQINESSPILITDNKWVYYRHDFIPEVEFKHLTIGNFYVDDFTQTEVLKKDHFNFAYYYIDMVTVQKIQPIIPKDDSDLIKPPFEVNKIYQLDNIYFAFNETKFLPASFIQLNKLLKLMRKYPQINIQILGHTDNIGHDDYNDELSTQRAKAVADYLFRHEITRSRVSFKGYGSNLPMAPNKDGTRNLNRRVEFIIKGDQIEIDTRKSTAYNN